MKVVLADDEPLARNRLRRLLGDLPGYDLVGEAADGKGLLKIVEEQRPDVVLLDIHMPGMDGLHAARKLSEMNPPPAIIFTTAHSEHALSAFGTAASGYLLKPIGHNQLHAALRKARVPSKAQLSNTAASDAETKYIEVRERDRLLRVAVHSVIYFQSEDKYTRLVWEGGEHLIDTSLRQIEERYPDCFLRVHRKVLVSPFAIQGLEKHADGLRLILRGCAARPPVSRRLAGAVRELLSES